MIGRRRARKRLHCGFLGVWRVASWSMVAAVGMLLSQLFALGHLVLFTHARCEHGAVTHTRSHDWQRDARRTPHHGSLCIASGRDRELHHDHCDPFATPPALASVKSASADPSLVRVPTLPGVGAREAERSVAILSVAPKTSPTV